MSDDAELLDKARAGDGAAMAALLERHEQTLYRFGLRMCGDEEAAREVLQETLLAAFKNLRGYRGDSALSTWLFQIARSFCIKQRRLHVGEPGQHETTDSAAARAIPADTSGQDERTHAKQVAELIQAALHTLPDAMREVLLLRDVEGLSAEEAAEVLGLSVPALKSRLHRARLALSAQLGAVLEQPQYPGCPELARELAADPAGDVDRAVCARIEEHLQRCPRCSAACDQLKRTVSLCRALPGDGVPAPIKAAVRAALTAASAPPRR